MSSVLFLVTRDILSRHAPHDVSFFSRWRPMAPLCPFFHWWEYIGISVCGDTRNCGVITSSSQCHVFLETFWKSRQGTKWYDGIHRDVCLENIFILWDILAKDTRQINSLPKQLPIIIVHLNYSPNGSGWCRSDCHEWHNPIRKTNASKLQPRGQSCSRYRRSPRFGPCHESSSSTQWLQCSTRRSSK